MIIDYCGYLLGVKNRPDWNVPLLLVAVSNLDGVVDVDLSAFEEDGCPPPTPR